MAHPDGSTRVEPDSLQVLVSRLENIRGLLNARAAGLWTCQANRVRLVKFLPVQDMPEDVVTGFSEALADASFERVELGCVRAAATREVFTAWAERLPDDGGSGTWLQRFEAARSVAVPILNGTEESQFVVAIALTEDCTLPEDEVARKLRAIFQNL